MPPFAAEYGRAGCRSTHFCHLRKASAQQHTIYVSATDDRDDGARLFPRLPDIF